MNEVKNSERQDLEDRLIVEVGSRLLGKEESSFTYRILNPNAEITSIPESKTIIDSTTDNLKDLILGKDRNTIRGKIKEKFYNFMLRLGIDFYGKEIKRKAEEAEKTISKRKEWFNSLLEDCIRLNNEGYFNDPLPDISSLPNINQHTKEFYKALLTLNCSKNQLSEMLCSMLVGYQEDEINLYSLRLNNEMNETAKDIEELIELRKKYETEKERQVKGVKKRVYNFFSRFGLNFYKAEEKARARRIQRYKKATERKLSELRIKIGDPTRYTAREMYLIQKNPGLFEHYKKTMGSSEKVFFAEELCKIHARAYGKRKKELDEYNAKIEKLNERIKDLKKGTQYELIENARQNAASYQRKMMAAKTEIEKMTNQLDSNRENKEFLSEMIELGAECSNYTTEKDKWSKVYAYLKEDTPKAETEEERKKYREIKKTEEAKKKLEQGAFNLAIETAKISSEVRKYQKIRETYSTMHNQLDILHNQYSGLLRDIKIDSIFENDDLRQKEKDVEIKACLELNPN